MSTANELFDQFMNINKQLSMIRHKAEHEHGPLGSSTRGQGQVLALLKLRDGVSTRDMAEIIGIRVSSLNETLAKMEEQELITRTPSEDDKRVMLVELTEQGRAVEQPGRDLPAKAFGDFTEEERDTLGGFFERIVEKLGENLSEEDYERFEKMRERKAELARDERGKGGHGHGRDGRDGRGGKGGFDRGGRGGKGGFDRGGRGGRGGKGGFDRGGRGGKGGFDRGGRGFDRGPRDEY